MGKIFYFKRFSMNNEWAAMKVNTDGVLLGAAATLPEGEDISVLDAGTGGGTIALMLAQRLSDSGRDRFMIKGIDIDQPSADEAAENFATSPWAQHLTAQLMDLRECTDTYDFIVSNPPFYDATLPAPDSRRNTARHAAGSDSTALCGAPLSFVTLLDFASTHLKGPESQLSMILPADQEKLLLRMASSYGMTPSRLLRINTTPRKPAKRIIAEFRLAGSLPTKRNPIFEGLVIQTGPEIYTPEYEALVSPFYLSRQR